MRNNDFESEFMRRAILCDEQESCKDCKKRKDCQMRKSFYNKGFETELLQPAGRVLDNDEPFTDEGLKMLNFTHAMLRKKNEELIAHPVYSNE